MKSLYLFPMILLAFSCAESRLDNLDNNDNEFDQNDGIIINSYESDIMKGFPPTDSNLVTLMNWDLAPYNRWAYQHFRELVPTQNISKGEGPILNLSRTPLNLDTITFVDRNNNTVTVKEMIDTTFTDGFIVLKDGKIITEQYFTGMKPSSLHLLQSGSKSLAISLLAVLISNGNIDTTLTAEDYVPELVNSGYSKAKISYLLDMGSGVSYSFDFLDPESEFYRHSQSYLWKPRSVVDKGQRHFLTNLKQVRPHGSMFNYKDSETEVLTWIMEKSMQTPFDELFSKFIWSEIGAEYDAFIACDGLGSPVTCGGFNVSLRDFARFGLMFLNEGSLNGKQIIPASFVKDITQTANPELFAKGPWVEGFPPGTAYNNHFWLPGGHEGAYLAFGYQGQYLYIHPKYKVVIGKFSTYPHGDASYFQDTDWRGFYAISKVL